ncbi:MAG: cysteine desulfurase [Chitinophagaceae bacterium]|nr:cysteine desulfurase [Chitinophagaceae bacterium]MCW5927913.1 cysteine desulfurase [Chitinophagaceae bacterium]
MSTNINNLPVNEGELAAQAGLPDPGQLADIANRYFKESFAAYTENVPVADSIAAATTGVPALQDLSRGISSTGNIPVQDPSQTILPGVSSSSYLSGSDLVNWSNEVEKHTPGWNTNTPEAYFPGTPSFTFLQDIRALSAYTPGVVPSSPQLPAVKIPTETAVKDIGSLLQYTGTSIPAPGIATDALAAPHLAGTVARTGDKGIPDAFGFLSSARSIYDHDTDSYQNSFVKEEKSSAQEINNIRPDLFDVNVVRRDFPILQEKVNGKPLIWFDNAATTQKPQSVIDRLTYFYQHENSNVHRAAHTLAARSTDAYDAARQKVQQFLKAGSVNEIIFVRGATEAINLVAKSWGLQNIQKDDEIIVSHLEHHANIVPWQMLCSVKGAKLKVIPVDSTGQLLLDEYQKLLSNKTKLVAVTQVSNALGTVTPVEEVVAAAHRYGAKVLVDGAQAVSHMPVDVQAYDCDFYVFSGHKVFGPTGIGVVYGKEDILNATQPWQGGGNMIRDVTFEKTVYHPAPFRFEAGTGNIADAVGLGAAIDYVQKIGLNNINAYEHALLAYATEGLKRIPGLRLIGTAQNKASVASFVLEGYSTEQVGQILNKDGIAVRSGHHCAQPILRRFGVEATVRPSFAFYNTCEEIDVLIAAIWNLVNGRSPGLV